MEDLSPLPVGAMEPQRGDIIVARDVVIDLFTVSQFPGLPQFSASSRREAVDIAGAFASRHAVDLWYYDGRDYERLTRHRHEPARGRDIAAESPGHVAGDRPSATHAGERMRK